MSGVDFYHQHMLREVLTGTWGDPADLNGGFTADYTATIAETLNVDEMHVVAFVANYNPGDVNNCTVYNSAQEKITFDAAVSGETVSPVSVIVNGKTIRIAGVYDSFELFDLSGRCVMQRSMQAEEISVEGIPGGVYLMRMQTQEGNRACKIVLSE